MIQYVHTIHHDFGPDPCNGPAFESVTFTDYPDVFAGHRTIDGSTPHHNDPLLCGSCGRDTGLLFARPYDPVRT